MTQLLTIIGYTSLALQKSIYNLRTIEKIMMRNFLPNKSINRMDLYMTDRKFHLLTILLYLGYFNISESILYIKKSSVNLQIIFNKNVMSCIRSLVTVTPTLRPGQIIKMIYNTRLATLKMLIIMKIQINTIKIC